MVGAIQEGLGGITTTMLKGFDTVLQSSNAALKEVAEAKRDLQQTLDMVIRAKADAIALSGGMGGMAPGAARGPVAVAVAELDEAKEIRRAAQATDQNYRRQQRDPATGRFVKREQAAVTEVQQQREDRFDATDKRVNEATKQRDEQQQRRQEQLDRADVEAQQRISPASQGRRRRLDYDIDVLAQNEIGEFRTIRQQTRRGIRESVYRAAAARAEPYLETEGMASDLATRQVERIRPGLTVDPTSGNFIDPEGNIVPAQEAVQPAGSQSSFARKAMTAQLGMRALDAWRGGAPVGRALASAIPSGVLKAGGIGLAAISTANQVWQGVQNQYEENRQYQEVYGGSNLGQLDDRFDRWINKNIRGRFSFLGGGNYDALFGQAMEQGLSGGRRDRYIDEGAQLMGQGVNQQQTGQILGIATETGQALEGLSDAIRSVNNAAKDAGINARRARDIFIQNYQASSDIMFGGAQSQGMATAVTQAQVGMARQFQDVNFMGSYGGDAMRGRMLAGRMGMPYTEWIGATMDNPNLGMIASEAQIQEQLSMLVSELPGESRRIPDVVQDFMDSIGGPANFNPQFDQAALGNALVEAGFSPELIHMFLTQNGVQVDVNDAPAVAAMYFTSETPGQIGARTDAQRAADLAPGSEFATDYDAAEFMNTGIGGASEDLAHYYLKGRDLSYARNEDDMRTEAEAAAGQPRNLIVEEFINAQEDLGLDFDTELMIQTREEDGTIGRRVVGLDWALQFAPDQIPTAQIMSGANDDLIGQTVAQALNLPEEAITQYGEPTIPTLTEEDLENEDVMTSAQWQEENPPEEPVPGEQETTVVFDLTPRALQLLQQVTTGTAYDTGNSQTGTNIVNLAGQSVGG